VVFPIAGRELAYTLSDQARIGDHQWYISDFGAFEVDYPEWRLTFGIEDVLWDIYECNVSDGWRWCEGVVEALGRIRAGGGVSVAVGAEHPAPLIEISVNTGALCRCLRWAGGRVFACSFGESVSGAVS
jgi:hypothetical protein